MEIKITFFDNTYIAYVDGKRVYLRELSEILGALHTEANAQKEAWEYSPFGFDPTTIDHCFIP